MSQFYVVAMQSWFIPGLFNHNQEEIRPVFGFLRHEDGFVSFVKNSQNLNPFVRELGKVHLSKLASPFNREYLASATSTILEYGFILDDQPAFGIAEDNDSSVSHIPWSLQMKHRIKLDQASLQELGKQLKQSILPTTDIRYHVHIFPYGIVNLFATIAVQTVEDVDQDIIGRAIQWVVGRAKDLRKQPSFVVPNKTFTGSINEWHLHVTHQIARSLFVSPDDRSMIKQSDYIAVHFKDQDSTISDEDSAKLLAQISGERNPDQLRVKAGDGQSAFGKYTRDQILVTSSALLVITKVFDQKDTRIFAHNPEFLVYLKSRNWQASDRKFFWRLLLVVELGINQKILFDNIAKVLRGNQLKSIEVKRVKTRVKNYTKANLIDLRVFKIIFSLLLAHEHLFPNYRKWYHIMSGPLGIQRRRNDLSVLAQQMLSMEQDWSMPIIKDIKALKDLLSPFG
jgi:hypothetical protein